MRSDERPRYTSRGRHPREDRTGSIGSRGRSGDTEPEHHGIPKQYIIPFVVIAALILLAIGAFVIINSGSGIASIYIGNVEMRDRDDDVYSPETFAETVYIPLLASSDGFGEAEGTATIEITYGDNPTVLHTEKVRIKDDFGSAWVHMDRFVLGNGEYTIKVSAGSHTDSRTLRIVSVTEDLDVTMDHAIRDNVLISHSYGVSYTATPVDKEGRSLGSAPMPFDATARLVAPSGEKILARDWPHLGSYILEDDMAHTMKGEYTLTIEWTNLMCRQDSPYRIVTSTMTLTVDAPPFANTGGDREVSLVGGEAEVQFDASGSGDDGTIVEYLWDFGDGETITTQTPFVAHIYTEAGEFYLSLVVKDDFGQTSTSRWGGAATIVVTD